MQDFSNLEYRKQILKEIEGDENLQRKAESFQRSEIYNRRAAPYIEARLKKEFPKSAASMRKILSINPTKRVVDKQASLYLNEPERSFAAVGRKGETLPLSDEQQIFLADNIEESKLNSQLQKANRVKKYQKQLAAQVLPLRGCVGTRILQPHQYDVVPLENDPETAFGYVVSAYDASKSLSLGDGQNQSIADKNDSKEKKDRQRFVWWSAKHNFITNGHGDIVSGPDILNPIKELPFIDIHEQKENEFFVRTGSPECDFTIDLAIVLSDAANINKLQGFAQLVLIADKAPDQIDVGPENMTFLQTNSETGDKPDLKFITPNPNLDASLSLVNTLLALFMSSIGQSPKLINGKGESEVYTSGLDRMLAQLEQFESSKEDMDNFRWVESEVFRLTRAWANHYAGATNSPLTKVEAVSIPQEAYVQVTYAEPQLAQSQKERQESAVYLMEKGLKSRVQVAMDLFGLDEESAIAILKKIKEHEALFASKKPSDQTTPLQANSPDVESSDETQEEGA